MSTEILNTYSKYDSYKDSGIKELGKMPKNWELLSNKHIFSIKNVRVGKKSEDYDLLSLTLKGIVKRDMENPQGKFPAEFDTYQEVSSGDFVFCLFDVEETPRTVGLSEFDGMITGAYTVLEVSPSFDKNFIYYFYLNLDNEKMLKPLYRGLRNTIPKDWFMNYKTFVPTYEEQTAIARFLDQKIYQIDQAIKLKLQQIEKLNEYKLIVIQKAVTKGLNSNAKMKASGVSWIGDVPDHWEVKSIKRISRVARGASPRPIDDPRYFDDEGEYAWVRIKDVTASNRYLTETTQNLSKLGSLLSVRMQPNEIFLSIAGSVGKPIITKIKACIHDGFVYFPDWNQSEEFLYYIFLSGQPYLGLGKTGTQLNLNSETVGSIKIGLPSIDEQKNIVEYLDIETNKANELIEFQKDQIERLKEYKTILINQAVTGKIKVS